MLLQKRINSKVCCLVLILLLPLVSLRVVFAEALSPVGFWQTIDDETHQPRSIVQIWQQGDELRGKVIKAFYKPGESAKDVCSKCTGINHNRLILGMTFLWGMTQQDDRWTGGKILDPQNGKIYKCRLSLSPDGQQLMVRGYIGAPILGRTQTWLRQPNVQSGQ